MKNRNPSQYQISNYILNCIRYRSNMLRRSEIFPYSALLSANISRRQLYCFCNLKTSLSLSLFRYDKLYCFHQRVTVVLTDDFLSANFNYFIQLPREGVTKINCNFTFSNTPDIIFCLLSESGMDISIIFFNYFYIFP